MLLKSGHPHVWPFMGGWDGNVWGYLKTQLCFRCLGSSWLAVHGWMGKRLLRMQLGWMLFHVCSQRWHADESSVSASVASLLFPSWRLPWASDLVWQCCAGNNNTLNDLSQQLGWGFWVSTCPNMRAISASTCVCVLHGSHLRSCCYNWSGHRARSKVNLSVSHGRWGWRVWLSPQYMGGSHRPIFVFHVSPQRLQCLHQASASSEASNVPTVVSHHGSFPKFPSSIMPCSSKKMWRWECCIVGLAPMSIPETPGCAADDDGHGVRSCQAADVTLCSWGWLLVCSAGGGISIGFAGRGSGSVG